MKSTRIVLAAAVLVVGPLSARAQSYNGISCDDVRALSADARDYWAKRLNLSAEQRHRIRAACLQHHHRGRGRHTAHLIEGASGE